MGKRRIDTIVVGLGAMGSAATYQLAKRNAVVLGIDQYSPPHPYGSSYGDTRITRLAIGEGAEYVSLVKRSHEIWKSIEQQTGQKLLTQCGGLVMSIHNGRGQHGVTDFVGQTRRIAEQYDIAHENFTPAAIKARFPAFNITSEKGYFEPEAGYVLPEACVNAQLKLAKQHGAQINLNEQVISWQSNGSSVEVHTNKGIYQADNLILSTGPWMNDLLTGYKAIFKVYRQILYWFDLKNKADYEEYAHLPVYIWMFGHNKDDMMYGFPAINGPYGGMKLASESYTTTTSPQLLDRRASQEERAATYEQYVRHQLPGLSEKCVKANVCMYTVTPDFGFVIDHHPTYGNVWIASPCSGHGFKHSAAIGEILAQLSLYRKSDLDITHFGLSRFQSQM